MNQPRGDIEFLRDIETAATEALEFVALMAVQEFAGDRKTVAAVVQKISVIGEAANRIPDQMRQLAPEIPWQDMIAMRNKLIHDYYEIRTETVWQTAQQDLLPLISSVSLVLAHFSGPP